jgi:hypothetical protein
MSSTLQVQKLAAWLPKILSQSNLTSSLLFIIGDFAFSDLVQQVQVQDSLEKIFKDHSANCTC